MPAILARLALFALAFALSAAPASAALACDQAITVDTTSVTVLEGAAAPGNGGVLRVDLACPVDGRVTISALPTAFSPYGKAYGFPGLITIDPANGLPGPRTYLIVGRQDADNLDEHITLTLTSPGLAPVTVAVTVDDDEP